MEKVSVIMPVHNLENYIDDALISLKKQTYYNYELIVIDDGSTDKSASIIQNYANHDSRIKLTETNNLGPSAARKLGIELAQGDYLTFLDGDDFVSENWIKKLVSNIEEHDADMSVIGYSLFFEKSNKSVSMSSSDNMFVSSGTSILAEWISAKTFEGVLWDKMFRRNLFDNIEINTNIFYMEDIELINKIISKVNKLVYEGIPLYMYRQRKDSAVHSKFKYNNFSSFNIIKEMVYMSRDNSYLRQLAYTRLAKEMISLFRKMSKKDTITYKNKVNSILSELKTANDRGEIKLKNIINSILFNLMILTRHVFIFSRIQGLFISTRNFVWQIKRVKLVGNKKI